jgi:hypothetical protein
MVPPRFSDGEPIRFNDVEYELLIANAGFRDAFTLDRTVIEQLTVMPDSSARMRIRVMKAPRFVSKVDRLHWEAAGGRPYASSADRVGALSRSTLSVGGFSFAPQGKRVTFAGVRHLPASTRALSRELMQRLVPRGDSAPPALSLRQYGFLLAIAPLTRAARQGLLAAIGSLPGVHMCGGAFRTHSPHGVAFCVNGAPTSTEILLDPQTGVATVVRERLDHLTPLYPNMTVGSLVDSNTFTLQAFR